MTKTHEVQMRTDNYDILHNEIVKEKYPTLYAEVLKQDKTSFSSWYSLSETAYREYELYVKDNKIPYVQG